MATSYVLGCAPLWTDWMQGILLAGGTIDFFSSQDHSIRQPVYKDPNGMTPWANPLTLDAYGRSTAPIYFANDPSLPDYFLVVKNSNGTTDYTIDNYNGALINIPSGSLSNENVNLIRNPQFSVWEHQPVQLSGGNVLVTTNAVINTWEQVCDDWYLYKSNQNATDTVSRIAFTDGQVLVPYSPSFYLQYNCTANSGGETAKYIGQIFRQTSEFLNGQTVSFSFYAMASAGRSVTVYWQQFFGTGGSPSPTVNSSLEIIPLTTGWQLYTINGVVIPATNGTQQGTTEFTSYCVIYFALDTDTTCTYSFTNVQLEIAPVASSFKLLSYEQYRAITANEFRYPTGTIQIFVASTLPLWDSGWLPLDDGTIGNPSSTATHADLSVYNLFCFLWSNFADAQCPVSTGRGANAIADWNANKKITLPLTMSRLIGNYGTGATLTARVAGVTGGAETYALLPANVAEHYHNYSKAGTAGSAAGTDELTTLVTDTTDGGHTTPNGPGLTSPGTAFSIMNPFSFLPFYIHK